MSRYIASVIIFALLFAGVSIVHSRSDYVTEEILSLLETELSCVEDGIFDGAPLFAAQKIWDDHRSFFSAVVPHDKLDMIDTQFAICSSLVSDDKEDYTVATEELIALIKIVQTLDSPSFDRIL